MDKSHGDGRRTGLLCANESQLAAYVDGALDALARMTLEKHLADCESCLEQVSFLVRSSNWTESPDVPSWLITKAKALVSKNRRDS